MLSFFLFFLILAFVPFRKSESMYHAMGYSSILVMQAAMTFDPKDMDAAMRSLRDSLQTCQRFQQFYQSFHTGFVVLSFHFNIGTTCGTFLS